MELALSLAIIAVLTAITLGLLSLARAEARRTVSLSNLHTHAQAFAAYTGDWSEQFPHFTSPGFASSTVSSGGLSLTVSFFDAHRTWHIALADGYFAGNPFSKSFMPPRYQNEEDGMWPLYTPYHYACSFIADPLYWNARTRIGPSQFRSTRISQVLYPSSKSLIVETWPYGRAAPQQGGARVTPSLPVALVDGAARVLRVWNSGYERGDGYQFMNDGAIHFTDAPPLLHTVDGLRGRDVP